MKLKPINNLHDYNQVKKYLESVSNTKLNEEESANVSIFRVLIEEYERKNKTVTNKKIITEELIDNAFESVKSVSKYENDGIMERILKLGEEYGELSAEVLKLYKYKRTSESKEKIINNILLESTDCMIMIFDIMIKMGFTKNEICSMTENQVNKWLSQIKNDENK